MITAAHDAARAMIDAMRTAGIVPGQSIEHDLISGTLIRFNVRDDNPRKRNGWAVLHMPRDPDRPPKGSFGWWRGGLRERWEMDGTWRPQSAAERAESRRKAAAERAERAKAKETAERAAAIEAQRIWASAGPVDPMHGYLARKRLVGEGLRQLGHNLVVPMHDITGELRNVQRISPDGFKLFLKGGRVKGLMWRVGRPDRVACIGEGMATVATVRRATGHAVAAAFSAENLEPVARAIHMAWPALDLVICADNDEHLLEHPSIRRNLGLDYARAAAAAVGGRVAMPPARGC